MRGALPALAALALLVLLLAPGAAALTDDPGTGEPRWRARTVADRQAFGGPPADDPQGTLWESGFTFVSVARGRPLAQGIPGGLLASYAANGSLQWETILAEKPSGPLAFAEGRVFTLAAHQGPARNGQVDSLLALDASSGAVVGRLELGPPAMGRVDAGGSAVYAALVAPGDRTVQVMRVHAATLQVEWAVAIPGFHVTDVDVAGLRVVVGVARHGFTALDTEDGSVAWTAPGDAAGAAADGPFVYAAFDDYQPTVQALDPSNGTPYWTHEADWMADPCPPRVLDGLLIVHGSAPGSALGALRTRDGSVAWLASSREVHEALCDGVAVADGRVAVARSDEAELRQRLLRASDGALLWESAHGLDKPSMGNGTLVGFGFGLPQWEPVPWTDWDAPGWIALDAGAGPLRQPAAAFDGPPVIRQWDCPAFVDRSVPGERPIRQTIWEARTDAGEWYDLQPDDLPGWCSMTSSASMGVRLRVVDEAWNVATAEATFPILPEEATGSLPIPAAPALLLPAAAAILRRRR